MPLLPTRFVVRVGLLFEPPLFITVYSALMSLGIFIVVFAFVSVKSEITEIAKISFFIVLSPYVFNCIL